MKINLILVDLVFIILGIIFGFYLHMYYEPYLIYPSSSPSNYIDYNQISLTNNSVCIEVENPTISSYANSGSMIPTLNENSNGIEVTPKGPEDIHLGDLISYRKDNESIIHRVGEIGNDYYGWYIITKGDNNIYKDEKVRWEQIERKTIILVY